VFAALGPLTRSNTPSPTPVPAVELETSNAESGEAPLPPIPSLLLVSSKKKLLLSSMIAPPVEMNGIDPSVKPEIASSEVVALVAVALPVMFREPTTVEEAEPKIKLELVAEIPREGWSQAS